MRIEFIQMTEQPGVSMAEACRRYGISRKTGYKWLKRYQAEGEAGLAERSRIPKRQPTKLTVEATIRIVGIRVEHRYWGADKIRAVLRREGFSPLPGRTSIHRVLKGAKLINLRKRRKVKLDNVRLSREGGGELQVNDEWTIDFKGWWMSRDGSRRCYPLTVRDARSRFILGVTLLPDSREETVRQAMIDLFKKYGLPKSIHSDNGSPFACTRALLGLSKLSVWWLRLGIALNRSRAGCPQDNGAHERMHKDMKRELQSERADTQEEMDEWAEDFNRCRPHQALNGDTPAQHYRKSPRAYTGSIPEFDYRDWPVRRIDRHGDLKWHGMDYFLSEALRGEVVGLKSIGGERCEVWFCEHLLGVVDERQKTFSPRLREGEEARVVKGRNKQKAIIREFE